MCVCPRDICKNADFFWLKIHVYTEKMTKKSSFLRMSAWHPWIYRFPRDIYRTLENFGYFCLIFLRIYWFPRDICMDTDFRVTSVRNLIFSAWVLCSFFVASIRERRYVFIGTSYKETPPSGFERQPRIELAFMCLFLFGFLPRTGH